MSKKIYLNKSDSVASAIDKIIRASEDEVVLYIPRDAEVARTNKDIELLKREVVAAGKTFTIESVDDGVLELVSAAGIEASNPFLGRNKKTMSDIVVNRRRMPVRSAAGVKESGRRKRKERSVDADLAGEEAAGGRTMATPRINRGDNNPRRFAIAVGVTVLLTVLLTAALITLPRATVALTLQKMPHSYIGSLTTSPSIEESNAGDSEVSLRGVVFTGQKNITKEYPAHGTDEVGRKARGAITIYNNYGTDSQQLVASTRLVTPDGKIYRLDQDTTVPGATKKSDGSLEPGVVDVSVTADQPGDEYNIGPVPRFRIPGFQGSAKYEGFYGESKGSMTGGASGTVKAPTDEDLEQARADAKLALEDALKADFFVNLPEGIKILDGAYDLAVTREQVNDAVDKDGNFSLTLYGDIKLIGFSEAELVDVLRKHFEEEDKVDLQIHDYTTDYGEVRVDFEGEILHSAINFESTWTRPFNVDSFRDEIVGMNENKLKEKIFSTPGVTQGEVRLRPFWVTKVPSNKARITVDVN